MSLKDRAKEIHDLGVEERENFTPHGVPLKMYQYWRSNTNNARTRENWCHYWRVVAFWAPLMFLRRTVTDAVTSTAGMLVITLVLLAAGVWACLQFDSVATGVMYVLLTVVGLVLAIAGVVTGIGAGLKLSGETDDLELTERWEKVAFGAAFVVTLPLASVVAAGTYAVVKIKDNWNHDWDRKIGAAAVVAVVVALAVALVLWFVIMTVKHGWLFVGFTVALVVVTFLVIGGFKLAATFIQGWRARRPERPKVDWTDDDGTTPSKPPREPSRLELAFLRFCDKLGGWVIAVFSALADFVVFVVQVARVWKWKRCPLMDQSELTSPVTRVRAVAVEDEELNW